MAGKQYDSPGEFFDDPIVPWGSEDYGNPDPGRMDSLRKNAWAVNRAVYVGIPNSIKELNEKLDKIIKHLGI